MTHCKLAYIVKDKERLVLSAHETVQRACQCMKQRRAGSVLVVDEQQRLRGIFTGRDAVRALAEGKDPAATILAHVMTPNPITITPNSLAIEALREDERWWLPSSSSHRGRHDLGRRFTQ